MNIPDLSVDLGPAPAASGTKAHGRDTDGFVEALDALLGEIDEISMAMAAAGAGAAGLSLTPPPVPGADGQGAHGQALASLLTERPITTGHERPGSAVELPETAAAAAAVAAGGAPGPGFGALVAATAAARSAGGAGVAGEPPAAEGSTDAAPALSPMAADGAQDAPTLERGSQHAVDHAADHAAVHAAPTPPPGDVQRGARPQQATGNAPHQAPDHAAVHPAPTPPPGDVHRDARPQQATNQAPDHAAVHAAPTPPPGHAEQPVPVAASEASGEPASTSEGNIAATDTMPAPLAGGTDRPGASAARVAPAQVDRALVDAVRQLRAGREESRHVVLHLDPPELGAVNVHIVMRGEEIQLTMHSAHGDARSALTDQRASIQEALTAAGLELSDFDITGGEPDHRGSGHDRRASSGGAADPALVVADEPDGALRL